MEDPVLAGSVETTHVEPEQILKDLRKLWGDLAKSDPHGVLRACAMTLIVVINEDEDPTCVGETIARLMHEHPSRAIVVRMRSTQETLLEAQVLAQCWMPFGKRQQICCEQIELKSSAKSLCDAANVIRGLIVPDLPVIVYCPDPVLCQAAECQDLVALATKLIISSEKATDFSPAAYLHGLLNPNRPVADLIWARLTPWREAVSRIFETPENRRAAYQLTDVNILYSGAGDGPAIYYFGGWFMHVLGAGVHLNVARGVGPSYASIARVDLHGPSFEATVDLVEANAAEIRAGDLRQRIVFPEADSCEELRKELSIAGRDPIFEDVLGLAVLMKQ